MTDIKNKTEKIELTDEGQRMAKRLLDYMKVPTEDIKQQIEERGPELTGDQLTAAQQILEMLKDESPEEKDAIKSILARNPDILLQFNKGEYQQALEKIERIRKNEKAYKTVFMVLADDEGKQYPLTGADFIKAMKEGADPENPNKEARDILQFLLSLILEFAGTQDEVESDPVRAKAMAGLELIFNYLQQEIAADDLEEFFKGSKEFMAIPRPAGIENLLSISAGAGNKEITVKEFAEAKITFEGRLAIDEQKINEMLKLAFANNNPYKATKNLNTRVEIPFRETMEILGRAQTDRSRKKFSAQLKKEILPTIAHTHIDLAKKDGSFLHMEIGGGTYFVDVRRNKISFKLNDDYAAWLIGTNFSQYSSKTLRLGNQKNPLPFYMAIKLQDHYFHDGNRHWKDKQGNAHATNNILKVQTLLDFCSDTLPSYDYVQQTDPGHWIRRIREPFEDALKDIKEIGLFDYQYCKKGLEEATPQEIRTNDYYKWSDLYITFKLLPEEPDQTKRLEHKRERIEAAQAKKALKEAETIVKADEIEKRKSRKKKKE